MAEPLEKFEHIVRRARIFTEARSEPAGGSHPFDERDIHSKIQNVSKKLFDDGHYAPATFEAYKLADKEVAELANLSESGVKLMMKAFSEQAPLIRLTNLLTTSEKDEQEGFKFIFSGSVMAIRNPRGHEYGVQDSPTDCLDHLSLASMLLRRLERARK
ncbi:TIGR02391 family protein [Xanthomonas campestris]|uniref:TIGR02391 family protein n=1 Tax=Xanthomonas campestris TaxID=339 RepID=UPI001E484334|nr:TIGR02391 family protein [Xanthomonas campestris]MCC5086436.1 TIGR02391 family protein [Xanthomonas campestris]MCF8795255.1 TIGR02391 family protein [Xanthomonas campestris pv. campestris]MCF8815934.1 TIGR02391 family protein [Xanthomonas campestris pv. campestris]WHO89008.1 TIGR02391 family protein [Xanthomonas campestris]